MPAHKVKTKPPPGAVLAYGAPLARELVHCVLLNEGTGAPADLCNPQARTTLAGTPIWVTTPEGPGLLCTGGAAFILPYRMTIAETFFNSGIRNDFTVRIIHKPTSWAATTCLSDKFPTGGGSRGIAVFVGDSNGNLQYVAIATTQGVAIPTAMTVGNVWDFVMTRTDSTVKYYVNGVQVTGTSTFTDADEPDASPWHFGNNPSTGGNNYDGVYLHVAAWRRALSGNEIEAAFNDEGYAYIAKRGPKINVLAAGAAAAAGHPRWLRGGLIPGMPTTRPQFGGLR